MQSIFYFRTKFFEIQSGLTFIIPKVYQSINYQQICFHPTRLTIQNFEGNDLSSNNNYSRNIAPFVTFKIDKNVEHNVPKHAIPLSLEM